MAADSSGDMDATNWRSQLHPDARERIVNKITNTLLKNYPSAKERKVSDIKNIAMRFEAKIYNTSTSQKHYLERISFKLYKIDTAPQNNATADALPSNSVRTGAISADAASHSVKSELHEQRRSPFTTLANQSQLPQQLSSQSIHGNIAASGDRSSTSVSFIVPPVTSLTKISKKPNDFGQHVNLQSMSGISVGQGLPSNNAANPQVQVQGQEDSQQAVTQGCQNQQQLQNRQHYHYKQQLQHQLSNPKFKQENIMHSLAQAHTQQQQQQNVFQPTQLIQAFPTMDISVIPSAPCLGLPQSQQSSVQQTKSVLHPQSVVRQQQKPLQASLIHQQRTLIDQPDGLVSQQAKHLFLQKQQQPSRQQNNQSNQLQQQLVQQSSISGQQQQKKLLGGQSDDSSMPINQLSVHMLQQVEVPVRHQTQQMASALLPTEGKQSQPHLSGLQPTSENQLQPAKLQGKQSLSPQNVQQQLQTSGVLLQPHVIGQFQSQQALPEALTNSSTEKRPPNLADWQEEIYQKIKIMKGMYLPQLIQLYKKFGSRYQQLVSLPQPPMGDQFQRLKQITSSLEFLLKFLQVTKSKISVTYKDNLVKVENQIIAILQLNKSRNHPVSSTQQGEQPSMPHMHSLQQSEQPQFQTPQLKSDLQPTKLQASVSLMQKKNMNNLQYDLVSSSSDVTTAQKNMMDSQQPGTKSNSDKVHAGKTLHQDAVGSLPIPLNTPQQSKNSTSLPQSSQHVSRLNTHPRRLNSNMLQQMHLKQQKELEMVNANQMNEQFQQHKMQLESMKKKEEVMQRQQPAELGVHKMPQNRMNGADDFKVKQTTDLAPALPQSLSENPHSVYNQHQLKSEASVVSSPQLHQPVSNHIPQNSIPNIDHKDLLLSSMKTETSLKSVESLPSTPLSTPLSQSPRLGDSGHQKTTGVTGPAIPPLICTPGRSPSHLLEEPLQRLIELVKSMSPEALNASVNDIESVVNMGDGTAGSLPGNGGAAAVGEDLAAMTKGWWEARDFRNQDETTETMKMNRCITAAPLKIGSMSSGISDRFKRFSDSETSDLESLVAFRMKKPKVEVNHALLEEIKEINEQLVDTVVDLSEEDIIANAATVATEGGEGTIIKCSFSAVVSCPNSKSQIASAQMSPVLPLHLLVPTNYPNCSPMLLDQLPMGVSEKYGNISEKAKLKLSISLKNILEPMSLGQIAMTWDNCVRAVISEHVQQSGGGSFSMVYGTWENCLSAA